MILKGILLPEVIVVVAFFLASLVHTVTGFGSALVGMPLLVLGIGLERSAPLLALLSQVVNLVVLWRNWKGVRWFRVFVLILSSIFGVPLGLFLLKGGNEDLLNVILGLVLIFHSFFLLFFENRLIGIRDSNGVTYLGGVVAGFIAGVLGGAYNANGPPVIIYTSLFERDKANFRSTLQLFFVVNGFIIIAGHCVGGLITAEVWRLSLYGLPGLICGAMIGLWLDRYITPGRFRNIVIISILVLGIALLFQVVF